MASGIVAYVVVGMGWNGRGILCRRGNGAVRGLNLSIMLPSNAAGCVFAGLAIVTVSACFTVLGWYPLLGISTRNSSPSHCSCWVC